MTVREATEADRPAVLAMVERFVHSTAYQAWEPGPGALDALFDLCLDHGVVLVVDGPSGRPVGFLALVVVTSPLTREAYAEELGWWVDPEHRGRAGVALLAAAERWTGQQGVDCLKMVQPFTEPTVGRLLERRGFDPVETSFAKRALCQRSRHLP